jgi:deoxycytidylate deaminase
LEKNNQKCQDSKLFERDLKEEDKNGQQLEKIFKKSDFFIEIVEETSFKKEFTRFFDLLHSHPFHTPEQDEYFMFMAYASSTRSASLSRQVGALIVSENTAKDVVSIGCNEVPKNGGGQYWPNDKNDTREFKHMDEKGQIMDSNKRALNVKVENLTKEVNQKLEDVNIDVKLSEEIISECVKASRFNESIEDFREEHAECSAISSCARNGIATQGSKLYCTTFPCHLCIKQIVSAGIIEVKFVEPYPKSKINLYEDSVTLNNEDGKVKLKQFLGVGPRRYLDLFSMTLSNGNDLDRSYIKKWEEGKKEPRMPMYNLSNIINNFLAAIKGIYYYSLNYSN